MTRAWWKHTLIAESDRALVANGRYWFPRQDVRFHYLRESHTRSESPDLGPARYWHVIVDGELRADAAVSHPDPSPERAAIRGRVAFQHGVEIESA
ncbi:MAG TPA: DUF427 domain-containing protein [Gemmatimonadota bacterium]|nr:DUF427 domain-containing protein [Gemmatimonadota bacterium]